MDIPPHQVRKRIINHPMARHRAGAGEAGRDHDELVVPAAALRAFVPDVLAAFVEEFNAFGVQDGKPGFDGGSEAGGAQGLGASRA